MSYKGKDGKRYPAVIVAAGGGWYVSDGIGALSLGANYLAARDYFGNVVGLVHHSQVASVLADGLEDGNARYCGDGYPLWPDDNPADNTLEWLGLR